MSKCQCKCKCSQCKCKCHHHDLADKAPVWDFICLAKQGFFQAFSALVNSVRNLNLNWKTQFIIRLFFLYYNLFDPEKTYAKVKSSLNTKQQRIVNDLILS